MKNTCKAVGTGILVSAVAFALLGAAPPDRQECSAIRKKAEQLHQAGNIKEAW